MILTPQATADADAHGRAAEAARGARQASRCWPRWMGGVDVAAGEAVLTRAGIPTFADPDTAARVFTLMWRYSYVLRGALRNAVARARHRGRAVAARARGCDHPSRFARSGRTLLTEVESKQVLAAYGIPVVETRVAATEDEAAACARELGFPVVLKLYSETITHKTEVGGVQLNLQDEAAVRQALPSGSSRTVAAKAGAEHVRGVTVQPMVALDGFELIVGSSVDPQFGPVRAVRRGRAPRGRVRAIARWRCRRSTRRWRGG